MGLGDHLRRVSHNHPEHVAVVAGTSRLTYGELDAVTDRLAASLMRLGIKPGDRVALQLANGPELVQCYYACFKAGAIGVPVNYRFAPAEIEYTLNHSACRICISQSDLYANVAAIRPALKTVEHYFLIDDAKDRTDTRPFSELTAPPAGNVEYPAIPDDAVAAILYTSGTTSRPKGVTHTHKSLTATAAYHGAVVNLRADDIFCVLPPMCHILGFATQLVSAILVGARLVLLPKFEPELVLRTIQEHRATRIAGLPVMFNALVNHPKAKEFDIRSLRTCFGGGDAVPVALQEKFRDTFGVLILEGCGMTEVIPFTLNLPDQLRVGSIGRACAGMDIRIVDETGRDVASGGVGEMLVKSDAAMIGYWREPEISAATLDGGYVHTGDLGRVDEDGFYWFMGRKKEIIIRAGSNISPLEVEEALYQHPAVRECGVVGVPDPNVGEVVWAYVSLTAGQTATAEELCEFARGRIASYKAPEQIRFLTELPKGPTGKVHRRTLREQAKRERSQN